VAAANLVMKASPTPSCTFQFRVRYAETDRMGTFYNARALEWFEVGRSELARAMGLPYGEWEKRGVFLPLVESHVRYQGRASYDDLLEMTVAVEAIGLVRLKFSNTVVHAESRAPVCAGHTVHVLLGADGRPVRMPGWVEELVGK
jgi:acyl-CoA thioester hydrolase